MQTNSKKAAFTLLETMIASSIGLLVIGAVLSTTLLVMKTAKVALTEAQETMANVSIDAQIKRDLHGVTQVYERSSTFFHFQTTDPFENDKEIYYKVNKTDGVSLIRNDVTNQDVESTLLNSEDDGLEDVTFTYYNQRGEEVSTIAETNAMQIQIERSIEGQSSDLDRDISITLIMFRNKIYDLEYQ